MRVIGRDAELAVVGDLLDAIRVGPAGLVLEGPPGIGKTAILKATVDLAYARSCAVPFLSARTIGGKALPHGPRRPAVPHAVGGFLRDPEPATARSRGGSSPG